MTENNLNPPTTVEEEIELYLFLHKSKLSFNGKWTAAVGGRLCGRVMYRKCIPGLHYIPVFQIDQNVLLHAFLCKQTVFHYHTKNS